MTDTRRNATAALVLGLLAAALLTQNADAQRDPLSANVMLPRCKEGLSSEPGYAPRVFQGMCTGIVATLLYVGRHLPPRISSCPPQAVTVKQVTYVVVAYIERRPERMHEDFRLLAIEAAHEAWPCR